MYRIFASRSQIVAAGAVATLAIGLLGATQASADGLNISTSYGGGHNSTSTKAWSKGDGSSSGAIAGSAGAGLG